MNVSKHSSNEIKFTQLETYFPCTKLDFCQIVTNIISMGWGRGREGKANNIKRGKEVCRTKQLSSYVIHYPSLYWLQCSIQHLEAIM